MTAHNEPFEALKGEVIVEVIARKNRGEDVTEVQLHTASGRICTMLHYQDCCEWVRLVDVAGGELEDLIGQQVLDAYVTTSQNEDPAIYDSHTWTFYTIATNKVTLVLRWLGESNGYYAEDVAVEWSFAPEEVSGHV